MKSGFNGKTFEFIFEGGRFHMLPQSYKFSHSLCLNNYPQFWLIRNQRDQVILFRYINRDYEVSHLIRGSKVLGDINHLMSSVKRAAEAAGIWTK